jgi:serine protease SohB
MGTITAVVFDIGGVLEQVEDRQALRDRWSQRLNLDPADLAARLAAVDPDRQIEVGAMDEPTYARRYADALGLDAAQADAFMRDLWDWYCGRPDQELIDFMAGRRPAYRTGILSDPRAYLLTRCGGFPGRSQTGRSADGCDLVVRRRLPGPGRSRRTRGGHRADDAAYPRAGARTTAPGTRPSDLTLAVTQDWYRVDPTRPAGRKEAVMRDALIRYGLFLAETVTLVLAVIVLVGAVVVLINRQTHAGRHRPAVELKNLNQRYDELGRAMRYQMLPRPAARAARKADRKADRAREKTRTRQDRRRAKQPDQPDQANQPNQANQADQPDQAQRRPRLFVLDFHGDLRASQVTALRDEVTAVLMTATERDEVVLRLENPGGTVHEQGLAASQLQRLKDSGIQLTVAVDKVAASGGYLMACVAQTILAAPFAIVGSIGVIDQLPNFHRLLDRAGIDFEMFKGGDAKRTVTMFGRTTEEDRARRNEQVQEIHDLFKQFVAAHRPGLDLARVATGQYWYGQQALELGLVDQLVTSDDYLLAARDRADIFHLRCLTPRSLRQRLAGGIRLLT